jgi:DNA-binding transcriptional MocR family regulator
LPAEGTTLKCPVIPALRRLNIRPKSACPLYRQLYSQLRRAILEQKLPAGARLPSTRTLARTLGVSRNTVLNAYEALIADTLLVARRGSGTCVSSPSYRVPPAPPIRPSFDLWTVLRKALYPTVPTFLCDPDGNPVCVHR